MSFILVVETLSFALLFFYDSLALILGYPSRGLDNTYLAFPLPFFLVPLKVAINATSFPLLYWRAFWAVMSMFISSARVHSILFI